MAAIGPFFFAFVVGCLVAQAGRAISIRGLAILAIAASNTAILITAISGRTAALTGAASVCAVTLFLDLVRVLLLRRRSPSGEAT